MWARFKAQKESDFGSDIWPLFLPFLCVFRNKRSGLYTVLWCCFFVWFFCLLFCIYERFRSQLTSLIYLFIFGIIFMFSGQEKIWIRFGFRLELPGKWNPTLANTRMKLPPNPHLGQGDFDQGKPQRGHVLSIYILERNTHTQTIAFFCVFLFCCDICSLFIFIPLFY